MIGWYYLNINYASADLGYPIDRVSKGLNELQKKGLITYSEDTNMVVIHNFLKYNPIKGPKQAKGAINNIENLADKSLLETFASCVVSHKRENKNLYELLFEEYSDRLSEEEINPIDRVSKGYRKGINTDTDTDTDTNTDTNTSSSSKSSSSKSKPKIEEKENNFSEDKSKIPKKFNETFGNMITTYQMQMLNSYKEDGLPEEVIIKALEQSALNNANSLSYVKKILDDWLERNIDTVEKVKQAINEHKSSSSTEEEQFDKLHDQKELEKKGWNN